MNAPLELKQLDIGTSSQHRSMARKPGWAGGRTKPALKRPGHGNPHDKEYYRALRAAEMAVWNRPQRKRPRSSASSGEANQPLSPAQVLMAGIGFLFLVMFLASLSGGTEGQEISLPATGWLHWLKITFA